jgi:hypothetical protein
VPNAANLANRKAFWLVLQCQNVAPSGAMQMTDEPRPPAAPNAPPEPAAAPASGLPDPAAAARPREIGGRDGPDPTRFGDWEKAGRCIDF